MKRPDLPRLLEVATRAASRGGEELLGLRGRSLAVSRKADGSTVTAADLAAERVILAELDSADPDAGFVSEEAGVVRGEARAVWIVDPLDGTVNYARGLRDFAVAIALAVDGQVVLGVVHLPDEGHVYAAVAGEGAFRDGEGLALTPRPADPPVVGIGFGCAREIRAAQAELVEGLLRMPWSIREPGSASVGLCRVASGEYDAYLEFGLGAWDVAAGALLVVEAGGRATEWDASPLVPFSSSVVAAQPEAHSELVELVRDGGLVSLAEAAC